MAKKKTSRLGEKLGEITVPSGIVLVVDTGLLHLWCHDRPPVMQEGIYPPETVQAANNSADYLIEGPDAERAGKLFNRQWNPHYLFDLPAHLVQTFQDSFESCIRQNGLDARMTRLAEKVPHRRRVDLALEYGKGAGQVFFQGITAIAFQDLPRDRPLPVLGERMPPGPYDERWHWVFLECQSEGVPARTEMVGHVAVDEARLMFADIDALGAWEHERPLDGLADYVFWGRDAEEAARQTGAIRLSDSQWGWCDLPVREAVKHGLAVEKLREELGLKFAEDFRPHSHHYLIMKQARATPTESGTLDVGPARVCTFMTTWGDGFYPVLREMDEEGRIIRIILDLGNEQIVARQRQLEAR